MEFISGSWRFAATDVSRHLSCPHLTTLSTDVAQGRRNRPDPYDPRLELLWERGLEHERAFADHLRAQGKTVVELRELPTADAKTRTQAAMAAGADVIVQADLGNDEWAARADFLLRVDTPSDLGDWSYEVADTKLALETRGSTILQLCMYSERLEELQGRKPEFMHVVKPGEDFPTDTFRVSDYDAYFRHVRNRFLQRMRAEGPPETYPDPVPHCEICEWWKECDSKRHADDHLSLVAGIRRNQIDHLQEHDIATLEELGNADPEKLVRPKKGSIDSLRKAQSQAAVQLEGRKQNRPVHEFLSLEEGRGFYRLPEPSDGDIFLDFEGDPFMDGGSLEYLHGYVYKNEAGEWSYQALWGLDRPSEKAAFEAFIDFVIQHWERHPGLHIYHYGVYERTALQGLVGRHGTRDVELDRIFRGQRMVDLHSITKQSLRASVERYSLKDLEPFFGFERATDLRDASAALRSVEAALERGLDPADVAEDLDAVREYNREDCLATLGLRDWLETQREIVIEQGNDIPRPAEKDEQPSDDVSEKDAEANAMFEALTSPLPQDREAWRREDHAKWLLAHLILYYDREEKCAWWDYFRIGDLDYEDQMEDRKVVVGLAFVGEVEGGTARCPYHEYRFPAQELSMRKKDKLTEIGGDRVGDLVSVDPVAGRLVLKKAQSHAGVHPDALQSMGVVPSEPLRSSLFAFAQSVVDHGLGGAAAFGAAANLLLRNPPLGGRDGETDPKSPTSGEARLGGEPQPENADLLNPGETALEGTLRLARELDGGVLPVQGPPGTGKTYTAARTILELSKTHRVGITAVSHKVIRNLLAEIQKAATEEEAAVELVHKEKPEEPHPDWLEVVGSNQEALDAVRPGTVVGGTAWLWARTDAAAGLDYLFVDEAGQMSLAQVLATSRAATNLVLLGDPQQLQQPQRGAHPEGAEISALSHLLGGEKTLSASQGVFLETTRRLAPAICRFTSELYYEDRLEPLPGLERQALRGETPLAGAGLVFVPVEHEGNQSRSLEEVEVVAELVRSLVEGDVSWTNAAGESRPIGLDDVLVVAPYNAQVGALIEGLPDGARVGTVDRFQGQEAPVVIYSLASSSIEDAPRGMEFLFDPNRLNVATSRARCRCVLVGSPRVLDGDCRSPGQMKRANGVCRFVELANRSPQLSGIIQILTTRRGL